MNNKRLNPTTQFVLMLLVATGASLVLLAADSLHNHSFYFSYLIWNLFLAWLPLLFAWWLLAVLKRKLWSSWEAIGVSVLWLAFLPNSFYMVSDFIHLREVSYRNLLYDAVMLTSFISVAVVLGVCSLYLVHREVIRRFTNRTSGIWLFAVILVCSFAIYLGRDLRWNSWDILTNPGGLLFDVSDRLMHPAAYPEMMLTTAIFFILMCMFYGIAWFTVHMIHGWPDQIQHSK
ncbi:DUF1361 domain-containing protein [Aeromicrobium sp.]|nr:DUF1361 domain-containing protein [Candidatus Saccharibacteria bacterium]